MYCPWRPRRRVVAIHQEARAEPIARDPATRRHLVQKLLEFQAPAGGVESR